MKKAIAFILVCVMAFAVVACQSSPGATAPPPNASENSPSGGSGAGTEPAAPADNLKGPGNVTLKRLGGNVGFDVNANYMTPVIQEATGYEVEYFSLPAENADEKLLMEVAGGASYDVVNVNVNQWRTLMAQGALLPLNDLIETYGQAIYNGNNAATWAALSDSDGTIYGVPYMYPHSRELPVYKEVDVLIVGAGPAGIGAAVSAARGGAKTLALDLNGCVGGQATVGLVGPFMTSFDARNEKMIIRGVFEELMRRMVDLGGAIDPALVVGEEPQSGFYKIGHAHVGPFDHECFKLVATEMLLEAGAELLLHTQFIDVLMEQDRITGVVIANKSGLSIIRARIVVDCSGDADVAARAGVPFELGNTEDGNMQPATLFFRVGNVDTAKLRMHIRQYAHLIRPFYGPLSWLIAEKTEEWGIPRAEVCLFEGTRTGEYRLNVTRILDVDGTNADDLTRAEIEGLRQAHKVFAFLKKYAVGFENAVFLDTAETIGIRETRHIAGRYRLSAADVKACLVPENSIAALATNMDTHNKNDPGGTFYIHENDPYFGVPYDCLLPQGVSNLLVAGRSISADAVAGSATRMIPCCIAFGQAAGVAAAMAVQHEILPAEIDVRALRLELLEQGAFLGDE